jgi:hypothetical protein
VTEERQGSTKKAALAAVVILVLLAVWFWREQGVTAGAEAQSPVVRQEQATLDAPAHSRPVPGKQKSAADAGVAFAALTSKADAGDAQLAGKLVAMGQSLSLGEALAKNAANADKYVDKLCADAAKLRANPAMPDPAGANADAAAFMAPRMDYERPLDLPHGSLHLPDELHTRLRDPAWISKIAESDLQGLDFSWMTQLQQFDHWSYLGAGRLRDYVEVDAVHGAIPNYIYLMDWVKLRYAQALRRGDAQAASVEVRHLADLIRSQGILLAELVAVVIYRFDVPVRAAAVSAAQDVGGWTAPDLDELQLHRQVAFASLYFAYPGVDPETVRKAMGCAVSPCVAMAEAVAFNRSLGQAGGGENLALLNQLAAERGCDATLFARMNGTHEMATAEALETVSDDLPLEIPKHLGVAP